jgi:hypothetical protein
MLKKIAKLIFEPLNFLANRNFAEKIFIYFNKNKGVSYVVAVIFTIILFILFYIIPNIAW